MFKVKVLYKNKYGFIIEKIVKVNDIDETYEKVNGDIMLMELVTDKLDCFTV